MGWCGLTPVTGNYRDIALRDQFLGIFHRHEALVALQEERLRVLLCCVLSLAQLSSGRHFINTSISPYSALGL